MKIKCTGENENKRNKRSTMDISVNKLTEPRNRDSIEKKKTPNFWKSAWVAQLSLIAEDIAGEFLHQASIQYRARDSGMSAGDVDWLSGRLWASGRWSGNEQNKTCQHTHNTLRKQHWHEDLKIKASLQRFDTTFCLCSHETQTPCFICTRPRPAALRLRSAVYRNSPAVVLLLGCVCALLPGVHVLISPCIPLCARTAGSRCHSEFSAPSSRPATNLLLFSLFPFFSEHLRA